MKVIKDMNMGTQYIRLIVSKNGRKFKLIYDNRPGVPLGFDYRFKAELLEPDGSYRNVAGKHDIGFQPISYTADHCERAADAQRFFAMMEEHLVLMYEWINYQRLRRRIRA